jgi:hypothetical protein
MLQVRQIRFKLLICRLTMALHVSACELIPKAPLGRRCSFVSMSNSKACATEYIAIRKTRFLMNYQNVKQVPG